jgi:hypothetical protein
MSRILTNEYNRMERHRQSMDEAQFSRHMEELLEKAAHEGARRALKEIGLDDEHAGKDVQDLRTLIGDFRQIRTAVMRTTVQVLTIGVLSLLMAGAALKMIFTHD